MTEPLKTPPAASTVTTAGLPRTGLLSPHNVPLWMGLALAVATAALIVWQA